MRRWPIGYEDLRPHYDFIQREVGIAGDAVAERAVGRPRGAPYPMPPHPLFAQARLLQRGFAAQGLATAPLPLAINSRQYAKRMSCMYDGWCEAGCPTGALANPLVTHLAWAQRSGAEVLAEARVTRVITDERGRASGVEVQRQGRTHIVRSRWIVLAASVVENARLLLNSASPRHPEGLANRSGRVGRGLMVDIVAPIYGVFDQPTENHMGVSAGQLLHRGAPGDRRRPDAPGAYQWQIAPSLKPNDLLGVAATRADLSSVSLEPRPILRTASWAAARLAWTACPPPGSSTATLKRRCFCAGICCPRVRP